MSTAVFRFLVLAALFIPKFAWADIVFKAQDSVLNANVNEIAGISLYFENKTEYAFEGNMRFKIPGAISILSSHTNQKIDLNALDKKFWPLKLQIHPDASAGTYELDIYLYNVEDEFIAKTTVKIVIPEKRNVQLFLQNNYAIIRFENDSIQANAQLKNLGNQTEIIQLVTSIPTNYGSRKFERQLISLRAGQDTTLNLRYLADKELFYLNQFSMNLIGMYEDQEVFGHSTLFVQNASSNRSFDLNSALSYNWEQRTNRIRFAARNTLHNNPTFTLDGNYQFNANGAKYDLNSTMYQWGYFENQPIFTNTYIAYEKDKLGVRVGSILESFEKYINGRGLKVNYTDSAENYYLLAGFSDKSYDLLNHYGNFKDGNGIALFSQFQYGGLKPGTRKRYSGTILFDKDPLENAEGILFSSSIPIITPSLGSRSFWNLDLGLGMKKAIRDTLNLFEDEPGYSIGTNFQIMKRSFYIWSNNYYSSPYYIGNRKGTLNLNQRIGFNLGLTRFWLGYQMYNFKPKSFFQTAYQTEFRSQRLDLNFTWNLTPFMNLTLTPSATSENNMGVLPNSNFTSEWIKYESIKVNGNLSWRSRNNKHFGNLSQEGGYFRSSIDNYEDQTLRTNISYNYKNFNANFQYQSGGQSVYDLTNFAGNSTNKIKRLSASLNYNYYTNKKFRATAGLLAFEDSFSGKNYSVVSNIEYAIGPRTAVFGNLNLLRYQSYLFGTQDLINFQVGFSQSLQKTSKIEKKKSSNLTLKLFYDYNANGYFDEKDEIAIDKSVLIDEILFLTDMNGEINYKRVPYNTYTLKFPMEKGWYAPEREIDLRKEEETLHIPLQKSGTLKGRITIQFDPRLSLSTDTDLEGYTITARSAQGYVVQTRSDSQGNFLLFLPEGEYTISLNENEFPPYVYTELNKHTIKLVPERMNELPDFELKVQERKIEVKRFGSTP